MPHLNDLTVFVISSGEETWDDCLAALKSQDCTFRIEKIHSVAPMSAAFQAMPDRCQTSYFVQVDADMILKPFAIRMLYVAICESPIWVYRIAGTLYEEGFGVGGAVKCWKRKIFRFVSFQDCRTVDRELHNRLRFFGLRIKRIDEVLGIHRPRHSNFSLYLKTKSDIEKWRYLKRPASRYALPLIDEILTEEKFRNHRLLGALLGAMTPPPRLMRSKDSALERKRFNLLLDLFGRDASLSGVALLDIDKNYLRETFSAAFNDFRSKTAGNHTSLLKCLREKFSLPNIRDEKFVEKLINIVDQ